MNTLNTQLSRLDVDFTALWNFIRSNKANGDTVGSNDGKTWVIVTGNRSSFRIRYHVNFNYTLAGPYIDNN